MQQSKAWIVQAESDLLAAQRVHKTSEVGTYCQAIAKYQQCVEKSVKGMVAAINEHGVPFHTISRNHNPIREIDALRGISRAIDRAQVDSIKRILTDKTRSKIDSLCSLAPSFPAPGDPFIRNTEYPYESGGNWTAPASEGSFSSVEVSEAHQLAWVVHQQADRFVDGLRRAVRS